MAVMMSILPITRWLQSAYSFVLTTWFLRGIHYSAQAGLELAMCLWVRSLCLSLSVLGLQACTTTTGRLTDFVTHFVYSKPMATEDLYFVQFFKCLFFCFFEATAMPSFCKQNSVYLKKRKERKKEQKEDMLFTPLLLGVCMSAYSRHHMCAQYENEAR